MDGASKATSPSTCKLNTCFGMIPAGGSGRVLKPQPLLPFHCTLQPHQSHTAHKHNTLKHTAHYTHTTPTTSYHVITYTTTHTIPHTAPQHTNTSHSNTLHQHHTHNLLSCHNKHNTTHSVTAHTLTHDKHNTETTRRIPSPHHSIKLNCIIVILHYATLLYT